MSVKLVLDKLTEHNDGVIGCIVTKGGAVHHNLRDAYSMIDTGTVCEEAEMMFSLMDGLDDPSPEPDHVFLEMHNHSLFARRMDDGVLVVLNKAVDRRVFRQMQVGVNLFVKPLSRALVIHEAEAKAAPAAPSSEPATPAPATKRRFYRGVEY